MEHATMTRVRCTECFGRFFLENAEGSAPEGVKAGDTIPARCPICEEGRTAVVLKKEEVSV